MCLLQPAYFAPVSFSDRSYEAMGHYVVAMSQVEGTLGALVGSMIQSPSPYVSSSVTSRLSIKWLIELAVSVGSMIFEGPTRERFDLAIQLVRDAEAERNRMLHSTWLESFGDPDCDELVRMKTRVPSPTNQRIATMSTVPADFLFARADELRELAEELRSLNPHPTHV